MMRPMEAVEQAETLKQAQTLRQAEALDRAQAAERARDAKRATRVGIDARQGLRARAAPGTIVNAGFRVGGMALGLIQGTIVARLAPAASGMLDA
jgi:hypothetical protein